MGISWSLARPKAPRSAVRIKVHVDGVGIYLYTGRQIEPIHWDNRKKFLKIYPGKSPTTRMVQYFRHLEQQINDAIDEYWNGMPRLTFLELEERLNQLMDNRTTRYQKATGKFAHQLETFQDFCEMFVMDCQSGERLSPKRQRIKLASIRSYMTTGKTVKKFEEKIGHTIKLTEFSQRLIDRLSDFIILDLDLAMNTHAKLMMDLSQILKYAVHHKKITADRFMELKFDTRREETDSIYLTESEILELLALDNFSDPVHEIVRDVFAVGCFTGMRFSDYSTLDTSNVRNNRLEIIQKKTGKKVTIPIHPIVRQILEKYNYELPVVPPNNEFNRIIKIVGQQLPSLHTSFIKQITYKRQVKQIKMQKYEFLQTHTARRSFCSNEYLRGTEPLVIMAISGHRSHKSFMRYIKVSGDQFADQLEKIWAQRF